MASSPRHSAASPAFLDSDTSDDSQLNPLDRLSTQSLAFVESQYARYLNDHNSVSPDWRDYFADIHATHGDVTSEILQTPFERSSIFHRADRPAGAGLSDEAGMQEKLDQLIRNYRVRGHIVAKIDPLHAERPQPPELDPAFYGFTDEHLEHEFSTQWVGGPERRTLSDMLTWLQTTYCRSIGVQFMHIDSLQVRQWLQDRMERTANRIRLSRDEQIRILDTTQ